MPNIDLTQLFAGNNWIILLVGLFLFKDQIFAWLKPKPVDPTPVPVPVPAPTPAAVDPDHPVLDVITKQVLPVLLPIIVQLIQDQVKSQVKEQSK